MRRRTGIGAPGDASGCHTPLGARDALCGQPDRHGSSGPDTHWQWHVIRPCRRPVRREAGLVGQPRDGDPRASCVELDVGANASEGVVVAVHRVSYDIETVQARICKAGLPRYLRDRLADGRDEWTNWMVATGDEWLHRDEADPPPARFPATHGMRSRARQTRRVHQARQGATSDVRGCASCTGAHRKDAGCDARTGQRRRRDGSSATR